MVINKLSTGLTTFSVGNFGARQPVETAAFVRSPILRIMRSLMFFAAFTASLMRRFCFLLLAFLFPLQLFAGTLEPAAKPLGETSMIVAAAEERSQEGAQKSAWESAHEIVGTVAGEAGDPAGTTDTGDQPDIKKLTAQGDLEDQTLPAPFATLPLDWHPFPHFYPFVNDGTSTFIDLQRPPPLA